MSSIGVERLVQLYGLTDNPFEPVNAELRAEKNKVIILKGRQAQIVREIVDKLSENKCGGYIIEGPWSSGKTAIIMCSAEKSRKTFGEKFGFIYIRAERESEDKSLSSLLLKGIEDIIQKTHASSLTDVQQAMSKLKQEKLMQDITYLKSIFFKTLKEYIIKSKKSKIILAFDQLENIDLNRDVVREALLPFLRDLLDNIPREIREKAGREISIIVIVSSYVGVLSSIMSEEDRIFLREYQSMILSNRLDFNDIRSLVCELLDRFRNIDLIQDSARKERIKELISKNRLYPFTEDALRYVWESNSRIIGLILNTLSRALRDATYQGVDIIDEDFVIGRTLLIEKAEWVEAYQRGYVPLKNLIGRLLEFLESSLRSKIKRSSLGLKPEKVITILDLKSINIDALTQYIVPRQSFKHDKRELANLLRSVADYVVIVRSPIGGIEDIILIKVVEKLIRIDMIDALEKLLDNVEKFKIGKYELVPSRFRFITYGTISRPAKQKVKLLELERNIIIDVVTIDQYKVELYGPLRYLYEEIEHFNERYGSLENVPPEDVRSLESEIKRALDLLVGTD